MIINTLHIFLLRNTDGHNAKSCTVHAKFAKKIGILICTVKTKKMLNCDIYCSNYNYIIYFMYVLQIFIFIYLFII